MLELLEVRRLIALCARIIEKGQQGDYEHSEELFDDAQQRILALGSRKVAKHLLLSPMQWLKLYLKSKALLKLNQV